MSYSSADVEALHKACFKGKKKEVKALLKATNVDVNGVRSDGLSALHIASSTGSSRLAKFLIDSGANLEAQESHGATPLSIAAQNNNVAVVRLLVESGANKDTRRADGVTPLFIASQEGHGKVVEALLQAGADPSGERPNGATALFVAAQKGRLRVTELLLRGGARCDAQVEGVTSLEAAIRAGHMDVAQTLMAAGATVKDGGGSMHEQRMDVDKALERMQACLEHMQQEDMIQDDAASTGAVNTPPDEEAKRLLVLGVKGKMKRKDANTMSKKELKEKYMLCAKNVSKLEKTVKHLKMDLKKERADAEKEIRNWKMAFMIQQGAFPGRKMLQQQQQSPRIEAPPSGEPSPETDL